MNLADLTNIRTEERRSAASDNKYDERAVGCRADSPRAREESETMRDEGELRARAASVKANPSADSRSSYNNNTILATTTLPPTYNTTNRH